MATTTGEKFQERTRSRAQNIGMRTDRVQQLYAKERILHRLNEACPGLLVKGGTADWIRSPMTARFSPDLDLTLPERPDDFDLLIADVLSRPFYDEHGQIDDGVEVRAVRCQDLHVSDEPGVKLRIECAIGGARVPLKVDFAFGTTHPDAVEVGAFPAMFPGRFPEIRVLLQAAAFKVADKLAVMAEHRAGNTRVKDLWDIAWHLRRESFGVAELARAVAITFRQRGTIIDAAPACLTQAWAVTNEAAWSKWHDDIGLRQEGFLTEAVAEVAPFCRAALIAAQAAMPGRGMPPSSPRPLA